MGRLHEMGWFQKLLAIDAESLQKRLCVFHTAETGSGQDGIRTFDTGLLKHADRRDKRPLKHLAKTSRFNGRQVVAVVRINTAHIAVFITMRHLKPSLRQGFLHRYLSRRPDIYSSLFHHSSHTEINKEESLPPNPKELQSTCFRCCSLSVDVTGTIPSSIAADQCRLAGIIP